MDGAAGDARSDRGQVIAIVAGLTVLALGMLAVRDGAVSDVEEAWFRAGNSLPAWLYPLVWPFQQLGALVLGPAVALVALLLRRYRLAIAACIVTLLKLVGERAVKAAVSRERPGTSIGSDIELRGDVHASGESFVSGHAVLVAALAGVVTPYLPGRWRVVPWVLVGAVMVGRVYVGAHNPLDVICGAALGVAIAGVVNLATIDRRERAGGRRHTAAVGDRRGSLDTPPAGVGRVVAVVAVVALVTLPACRQGEDERSSPLDDDAITVGSFDFTESVVVAEIYSQALEDAGFQVERAFRLGPREFVGPALAAGLIEVLPEYAGTAAEFHSLGAAEPSGDVAATRRELIEAIAGRPLVALAAAPAQDANAFVVTEATAARYDLDSLSDLRDVARQLSFGGPPECSARPHCLDGLADVYGARFDEVVPLDPGGPVTRHALVQGQVDVALLFSTDPAIRLLDLVELTDDRGLQPAENITPLVRTEVVERWGDAVSAALDAASARLTTSAVRALNQAAAEPDADVGAIVAAWRVHR